VKELLLSAIECTGGIRQTEIHTEETFVPEPSAAEVEVAIRKMKRCKAPGFDQIPAEQIQAGGGGALHSEIHKLIMLIWNRRIASPMERVNCCTYSQKG
jgi:hypothetical protein